MPLSEALVVSPAEGVVPMIAAQGKWRKLDGKNRLPGIMEGIEFRDGIRQLQDAA